MRIAAVLLVVACSSSPDATRSRRPEPARAPVDPVASAPIAAPTETLTADTPKTTVAGNPFTAPGGWKFAVRGPATIVTSPEGDSHIVLVDVTAKDADAALALAWAAYDPAKKWQRKGSSKASDKDGWSNITIYSYQLPPNEKRLVQAAAQLAHGTWTVVIIDMAIAVADKRGGQIGVVFSTLLPRGYERESFAGRKAHPLDKARIAELVKFVEGAQKTLSIPGVSFGLVQDGKVVFAGGFGIRDIARRGGKVDADTLYPIASNTKALTTLMLAKLVDENKMTWETPAATLLPSFKLGDADITSKVQVKHLICACTGMPRQDFEWLFEFGALTPARVIETLATMKPTSKFGELFQYSNVMAGVAGFVGAHVVYPDLELGKAYDKAMQTRVFGPLGMRATTFDFKRARRGNYAEGHAIDVDGKVVHSTVVINNAVIPVRPAGGAWSSVRDMLKYVAMELAQGTLPNAKPYIGKDALLARYAPQVAIGADTVYGMGLGITTQSGLVTVGHTGGLFGYPSRMVWFPEHGVGAVVLTNSDAGGMLHSHFTRKLTEVLFDARPEADADFAAQAKAFFDARLVERELLTLPADAAESAKLAGSYKSATIGDITVSRAGDKTIFSFGEWKSEMATRKNADGTVSFVTVAPSINGLEFTAGTANGKRTLVVHDAQIEYVFAEQ